MEFKDCPRINVAEQEKSSLRELEKKIEDKYPSFVEKTIEVKIVGFAEQMAVPCCLSMTTIAGVVAGSTVLALTGGVLTISYAVALKMRKPKKKLKSS